MDVSAIYGLKFQARCVTSHASSRDRSIFLVGTLSLRDDNEIHLAEYSSERNEFQCLNVFQHKDEVWHIAASPAKADAMLVASNGASGEGFEAKALRMEEVEGLFNGTSDGNAGLTTECTFGGLRGQIRSLLWEPYDADFSSGDGPEDLRCLAVDDTGAHIFSLSSPEQSEFHADVAKPVTAAWNPHHRSVIAVTSESSVKGIDIRDSSKSSFSVDFAHAQAVRSLDFNPNRPYFFASSGDDGLVKFWDLRKPGESLKTLQRHSHWVCQVRYNVFHDQLVVSSSTDSTVNLWNVSSLSSAPLGEIDDDSDDEENNSNTNGGNSNARNSKTAAAAAAGGAIGSGVDRKKETNDCLIKTYDEHEDSVYSVAWSCCETDAWVFASLSFDGRVVINHVPQDEKYKILL